MQEPNTTELEPSLENAGPFCDQALEPKRYLISGFTAHGFHFLWCNDTSFHEQQDSCTCRFRLKTTRDRQHAFSCEYVRNHTLSQALSEVHSLLLKNVTIDE